MSSFLLVVGEIIIIFSDFVKKKTWLVKRREKRQALLKPTPSLSPPPPFFFFSPESNMLLWKYCNTVTLQERCFVMIVLELDIDHCCHWEKPCFTPPPPPLPPSSSSSSSSLAGPPCRAALQSWVGLAGCERNALGCGAAPTVGNRRHNSRSMDSNDPYLHLSKYPLSDPRRSPTSLLCFCPSCCVLLRLWFRVRLFRGVVSSPVARTLTARLLPASARLLCLHSSFKQPLPNCADCKKKKKEEGKKNRKLRPMQKSGDRGCAGQARSEVGALIALM